MNDRRDAVRVLLRIAFRNLLASPVRTGILGAIILVGSLIVVVGSSVLDSIDRGMRTSIQGSLGGQLQIYDGRSEDQLALYGTTIFFLLPVASLVHAPDPARTTASKAV